MEFLHGKGHRPGEQGGKQRIQQIQAVEQCDGGTLESLPLNTFFLSKIEHREIS